MNRRAFRWVGITCASLLLACSWQRFSDLKEDPPVVLLEKPDSLRFGYGDVVAVAVLEERVRALAGGTPLTSAAAIFELGFDEKPGTKSIQASHCEATSTRACFLAAQPAGFAKTRARGEDREQCFALGLGQEEQAIGLLVRCGNVSFANPVPDEVAYAVREVFDGAARPPDLYATADFEDEPVLLAASPQVTSSWFYAPLESTPRELIPPRGPGKGYGSSVAVLRIDGGRVLAVGNPRRAEVWLYRWLGEDTEVLGCLSGSEGFGRTMAAGRIDEDELDELVVATQDSVHVFDGASLAAVAPAPDEPCGTDWLPKGAETAQFSCEESSDTSDCAVSKFGQALAVADVDGDGRGEVVVGAPEMTVRGKSAAGAVLIYEVPSSGAAALADTRLLSTADSGNRFGAALATVPQRTRDVILAGVPGAAKTVLLYCNSLFDGDSSRCQ